MKSILWLIYFCPVCLRHMDDGIHNDVKCLARKWFVSAGLPAYITPARSCPCRDRTSPMEAHANYIGDAARTRSRIKISSVQTFAEIRHR